MKLAVPMKSSLRNIVLGSFDRMISVNRRAALSINCAFELKGCAARMNCAASRSPHRKSHKSMLERPPVRECRTCCQPLLKSRRFRGLSRASKKFIVFERSDPARIRLITGLISCKRGRKRPVDKLNFVKVINHSGGTILGMRVRQGWPQRLSATELQLLEIVAPG